MQRLHPRLRSLATLTSAKLSLFLATGFLFTVIHQIGSDTPDPLRLAKLFGIDVSDVTYGPGDRAALSTILSGLLLINTLPGLKSNGKQSTDLQFLDFAISALAISLTFSIGWNWLRDSTDMSQQSALSHIMPIVSFAIVSLIGILLLGVLVLAFYAIIKTLRIMLRWFSRQLAKLTPRFHRRNSSPRIQSLDKRRRPLVSFVLYTAVVVAVILSLAAIAALPIDFGDVLSVLGIWAMFGALVGQNRTPGTSLREYLGNRTLAVAGIGVMFFSMALVYVLLVSQSRPGTEPEEVFGLLVLAALGLVLGFIVGVDKDPIPRSRRSWRRPHDRKRKRQGRR